MAALRICGVWLEEPLESCERLRVLRPDVLFCFGVMYSWGFISGLEDHRVEAMLCEELRVTGLDGLVGSSGMVMSIHWPILADQD